MKKLNMLQRARFASGVMAVCALVSCAENVPPSAVAQASKKDSCDEAADYGRRAAEAPSPEVRLALRRIADTKSHECSANLDTAHKSESATDLAPAVSPPARGASELQKTTR